jgi:hypothetical protein
MIFYLSKGDNSYTYLSKGGNQNTDLWKGGNLLTVKTNNNNITNG